MKFKEMSRMIFLVAVSLFLSYQSFAQSKKADKKTIKLSGVAVNDSLKEVPQVSLRIIKTNGITDFKSLFTTISDKNGLFAIMVNPGDVVEFKKVNYLNSQYIVSDTIRDTILSIIQQLPLSSKK